MLLTKLKLLIFKISNKWIGKKPTNYDENSLEALLYIASLAMLADNKVKKIELGVLRSSGPGTLLNTFADAINSSEEGDIDVISNQKTVKLDASKIKREIIDEVIDRAHFNIKNFPLRIVVESAANAITKEDYKKLSLLSAIRMVACDLQIRNSESNLLNNLAQCWKLEELLAEILEVLDNWEEKRTKRLTDKIKNIRTRFEQMIDKGSISRSGYIQLEEKIAKLYPGLAIEEEWEALYREADEKVSQAKQKQKELMIKIEKLKRQVKRMMPYGNNKQTAELFLEHLDALEFHPTSLDILIDEFPDKHDIYQCLTKIAAGYPPENKRFMGVKDWKEISNIKTGNPERSRMGRIYFKEEGRNTTNVYKILLSVKKDEKFQRNQTSNMLKKWH